MLKYCPKAERNARQALQPVRRAAIRRGAVYTTLARASDSPAVRRRLYDLMDLAFVGKLKDQLSQADTVVRAR